MIKIFLVEDEKIVREGIKQGINWERHGFEFLGEASDGELAYPIIKEKRPDILLTDIKMPFMDGLELAEMVKKDLPNIRIMFFSGYDDFEYAKRAIKIGAADYLLKPVSSSQLLEALEQLCDSIMQERIDKEYKEQYLKELEERKKLERERNFEEMINGKLSTSKILELGRELGLSLSAPAYNLLLFQFKTEGCEEQDFDAELILEQKLKVLHCYEKDVIRFNRRSEGYAFLIKGIDKDVINSLTNLLKKELAQIVELIPGIKYFGGIGETVYRLSELGKCYNTANKAFAYRYLLQSNMIITYKDVQDMERKEESATLRELDITKIDRMVISNFIKNGSKEDVTYFLNEYFSSLGQKNMESLMFRQYILLDIYLAVTTFVTHMGMDSEQAIGLFGDMEEVLMVVNNASSAKSYVQKLLEKALEVRANNSQKKYRIVLERARDYILKNFQNEELSLNMVASSVNISANHFSTIFSQELGITFIEYLTSVRMDRAKELLKTTDMRSFEISYEVGYKDPHYFSYLFKKTQGMTPKNYRMGESS